MRIRHLVKFKMGQDFEMFEMEFEASDADLSDEERSLPFHKKAIVLQKKLITQGHVFKSLCGYISASDLQDLIKGLKENL